MTFQTGTAFTVAAEIIVVAAVHNSG